MIKHCEKCGEDYIAKHSQQKHKCKKKVRKAFKATFLGKSKTPKERVIGSHKRTDNERDRHYKENYGISLSDYNRMFSEQGGRCAICGDKVKLFVDHNHINRRVRGLLCVSCNSALGLLKDDVLVISKALSYLQTDGLRYSIYAEKKEA